MSKLFDNLTGFYACAVIFICRFAEGFVLPFEKASFICYSHLRFFL